MLGTNGQGKSNYLEAIGYLSALRSFRTQLAYPLFKNNADEFRLFYEIKHEVTGDTEVEINVTKKQKKILIDGISVDRLVDFISLFPIVTIHSGDLLILRGSPSERRRFIDMTLAFVDSEYLNSLRKYHKALQERNQLLKIESSEKSLLAFEKELAKYAFYLVNQRKEGIKYLGKILADVYGSFSEDFEIPILAFLPDIKFDSIELYEKFYYENRKRIKLLAQPVRAS